MKTGKMVKKKQPRSVLQHFLVLLQFHLQHCSRQLRFIEKMHGQKGHEMASSYATSMKESHLSDVRNANDMILILKIRTFTTGVCRTI